jgi:hypothetical protein
MTAPTRAADVARLLSLPSDSNCSELHACEAVSR